MSRMTTVEALRTILYENGMETLLDYPKLRGKLWDLAPAEILDRERFQAIYETGAAEAIHQAVMDAAHYAAYFARAIERLSAADDITAAVAEEVVLLFYDALGFPAKSPMENTQTISDKDWVYTGEVRNNRPHGRGREALMLDGRAYSTRDGQWLAGSPFGYFHSVDSLGVESYCFCIDGWTIGKETRIWSEDDIEVIDHGFDPDKVKPKAPTTDKETQQALVKALHAITDQRKEGADGDRISERG